MTSSQRFYIPFTQLFTNLGAIGPGWKMKTYATGTSTPLATYSDITLSTPNANPATGATTGNQVADENGRLGDMFVSSSSLYKLVMTDENDVIIETTDPVDPFAVTIADLSPRPAFYAGTTSGTSSAYTLVSDPIFTQYSSSDIFELTFHTECAAAPTLKYVANGAALNLKKKTGQGTKAALLAGDVNGRHQVTNDGIDIIVLDPRTPISYLGTTPTLTIAAGILILNNSTNHYIIEGEGSASDTLDTINGGADGQEVIFQIANASHVITFSLSGNILTQSGESLIVNSTTTQIRAFYRASDSKWIIETNSRPLIYYPENQTVTFNGLLTLPHGLGKIPDVIRTSFVNVTTEGGYITGNQIIYNLGPSSASFVRGISVQVDATNIIIRFGDGIDLITSNGTALFAITAAKWTLNIRALLLT